MFAMPHGNDRIGGSHPGQFDEELPNGTEKYTP